MMDARLAPFEQLPFEDVPALPHRPHELSRARVREVRFVSRRFGPVTTFLRELGELDRPPLLLVHGLMTTSYSWRYVIGPLARHFRVLAIDLLGAGRSSKPDLNYHPDAVAEWLGECIDALGIRGCRVIGNSMGGYLAMRLALRDPGAMERLLNVHSPGLPTPRNHVLSTVVRYLPGSRMALARLIGRAPERWVHTHVHYFDESLKSREEHAEYAAPLKTAAGVMAFHRMLTDTLSVRAMAAFEEALVQCNGRFPIPLMLLYAKTDPMVPPIVGERLHALLPSATYAEVERGSHFMHVDAPEAFLAHALPFLGVG